MSPTRQTAAGPRIVLRSPEWFRAFDAIGASTDVAKAEALGLPRQHVNAVQNGRRPVGEKLVAKTLTALGCRFEDVFEVAQ